MRGLLRTRVIGPGGVCFGRSGFVAEAKKRFRGVPHELQWDWAEKTKNISNQGRDGINKKALPFGRFPDLAVFQPRARRRAHTPLHPPRL